VVHSEFPSRGNSPASKGTWYVGGIQPTLPVDFEADRKLPGNGSLIVGSKATVFADTYYAHAQIIPQVKMEQLTPSLPPPSIPRVTGGHFAEWVRACKGGTPAGSNFDHASGLTETVLLSNVAVRARRRIEWDSAALKVTNLPEANQYISKNYRPGFGV
jgi:hypothetical protein